MTMPMTFSPNTNFALTAYCIPFLFSVFTVFGSIIKFNEYLTDTGSNISIPCLAKGSIIWVKEECNTTKEYQVIHSTPHTSIE